MYTLPFVWTVLSFVSWKLLWNGASKSWLSKRFILLRLGGNTRLQWSSDKFASSMSGLQPFSSKTTQSHWLVWIFHQLAERKTRNRIVRHSIQSTNGKFRKGFVGFLSSLLVEHCVAFIAKSIYCIFPCPSPLSTGKESQNHRKRQLSCAKCLVKEMNNDKCDMKRLLWPMYFSVWHLTFKQLFVWAFVTSPRERIPAGKASNVSWAEKETTSAQGCAALFLHPGYRGCGNGQVHTVLVILPSSFTCRETSQLSSRPRSFVR